MAPDQHTPYLRPDKKPPLRERLRAAFTAFITACRDPWNIIVYGGMGVLILFFTVTETRYYFGRVAVKKDYEAVRVFAAQPPYFFRYDLMKPFYIAPDRSYPLLVILGQPSKIPAAAKHMTEAHMRDNYPAFVMIPRISQRATWQTPIIDYAVTADNRRLFFPDAMPVIATMIAIAAQENPIDPQRIYFLGEGEGASGVIAATNILSSIIAGGIAVNGHWPAEEAIPAAAPLHVYYDESDDSETALAIRDYVATSGIMGNDVTLSPLPQAQRDRIAAQYKDEKMWQWLFKQKQQTTTQTPSSRRTQDQEIWDNIYGRQ